jgi:hypothetical protein
MLQSLHDCLAQSVFDLRAFHRDAISVAICSVCLLICELFTVTLCLLRSSPLCALFVGPFRFYDPVAMCVTRRRPFTLGVSLSFPQFPFFSTFKRL